MAKATKTKARQARPVQQAPIAQQPQMDSQQPVMKKGGTMKGKKKY